MIEIINLHKNFDNQEVLKGVDFKITEGQTFALIGSSGKGKSVLIKHIIGLLKPDSGKILIDQKDISHLHGRALKKMKERFGIVFQGGALFDSLTVFENKVLTPRPQRKTEPMMRNHNCCSMRKLETNVTPKAAIEP